MQELLHRALPFAERKSVLFLEVEPGAFYRVLTEYNNDERFYEFWIEDVESGNAVTERKRSD